MSCAPFHCKYSQNPPSTIMRASWSAAVLVKCPAYCVQAIDACNSGRWPLTARGNITFIFPLLALNRAQSHYTLHSERIVVVFYSLYCIPSACKCEKAKPDLQTMPLPMIHFAAMPARMHCTSTLLPTRSMFYLEPASGLQVWP